MQGLAIAIIIVTDILAKNNINQTISDYEYDQENAVAIQQLQNAIKPLNTSLYMNASLAGLMLLSFVFNAFTLGKPLRSKKVANVD